MQRDLVERARSGADRRSYDIRLTSAGRAMLTTLREQGREHADRFYAPQVPGERRQLHELLAKHASGLDERARECELGRSACQRAR